MTFDVIIVSCADNLANKTMTENCINSLCLNVLDGIKQNIIVVEKIKTVNYENVLTLHYDFEFNYNRCLNLGLKMSSSDFVCIANNDLIFHSGWQEGIIKSLRSGIGSVSPYCPRTHRSMFEMDDVVRVGTRIGVEVAGWCICMTKETLNKIVELNDKVSFWYSDDIYIEQLKRHNIKHGLVCNSFVTHLGSQTLKQRTNRERFWLTNQQKKVFDRELINIWK